MQKGFLFLFLFIVINSISYAQVKVVFYNNLTFNVPEGWYIKDSAAYRIIFRKTGDAYSKIEMKITAHKEKDLVKFMTLDKKKFIPDPHTRTVLPDASLGGKLYKKVKYFTKNGVLKVNTDLEYITLFKPKYPIPGTVLARLEIIITYGLNEEAAMIKVSDALVAGLKF